jgi:4-amino-4-deoxy-L-arabinose transferase-like glycosyltransferase
MKSHMNRKQFKDLRLYKILFISIVSIYLLAISGYDLLGVRVPFFIFAFPAVLLFFGVMVFGARAYHMSKKTKVSQWLVLACIVIVGVILRAIHLGDISFWGDEAITVSVSRNFLDTGRIVMNSGQSYLTKSPLNIILIAAAIKIGGISETVARAPGVIFGSLSIVVIFFLSKEYGLSKKNALITSFLIAVSPLAIVISRQARMYPQYEFFFLLTIFLWLCFLKVPKLYKAFLSLLSFVLALLSNKLAILLLPVAVVLLVIQARGFPDKGLSAILKSRRYWVFAAVGGAGLFIYFTISGFMNLDVLLSFFSSELSSAVISPDKNWDGYYLNYLYTVFPFHLLMVVIGAYSAVSYAKSDKRFIFLLVSVFIPLTVLIFILSWNNVRYLSGVYPIILIIVSLGIVSVSSVYRKVLGKGAAALFLIVALLSSLFVGTRSVASISHGYNRYFDKYYQNYIMLSDEIGEDSCAIATTNSITPTLYFNNDLYFLSEYQEGVSRYYWNEEAGEYRHLWSDLPYILNVEDLIAAAEKNGCAYVIIETNRAHQVSEQMLRFLIMNATEIDLGDPTISLFRVSVSKFP